MLILWLLLLVCGLCSAELQDHTIDIRLTANWHKTPFVLNVIESVAAQNESLYMPVVSGVLGIPLPLGGDEDDFEETELTLAPRLSDQEVLSRALSVLGSDFERALFNISVSSKIHSPRIQAHFEHYTTADAKCGHDSKAWAILNGEPYCHPDDVFALKTSKGATRDMLPFDRVIGPVQESIPHVILYGCPSSYEFKQFFLNLYISARANKISFSWRYIPESETDFEILNGYGVDLTLKRTDYIVIDDRHFDTKREEVASFAVEDSAYVDEIPPLKQEDVSDLDIKFTEYILSQAKSDEDRWALLHELIMDFPKYSAKIAEQGKVEEFVMLSSLHNLQSGLSDGIYINGIVVPEKKLNPFKLISVMKAEKDFSTKLSPFLREGKTYLDVVDSIAGHLTNFSGSSTRYNLSAVADAIVFLNNIETDPPYAEMSKSRDPYKQQIPMGTFPAVKENIYETIFVINLSDRYQLTQLLQSLIHILNNAVPQRIGLVPLVSNDLDELLAAQFLYTYRVHGLRNAISLLVYLANEVLAKGVENLAPSDLGFIDLPEGLDTEPLLISNKNFQSNFEVTDPTIVINGVFFSMADPRLQNQFYQDIQTVQYAVVNGLVDDDTPLKDYLLKGSESKRNSIVNPDGKKFESDSFVSYSSWNTFRDVHEAIKSGRIYAFEKVESRPSDTLWLVGSLKDAEVIEQLRHITEWFREGVRVVVVNTDSENITAGSLYELAYSASAGIGEIDSSLCHLITSAFNIEINESSAYIIYGGRLIDLRDKGPLDASKLTYLSDFEKEHRLSLIRSVLNESLSSSLFEYATMIVTQTYYYKETDYISGGLAPRYSLSQLDLTSTAISLETEGAEFEITILVDPVSEYGQKLVAIAEIFENIPSVSVTVVLRPQLQLGDLPIKRFFRGVYDYSLVFGSDGSLNESSKAALFESVPDKTLFTLDIDAPSPWIVMIKEAESDLDNVKLDLSGPVRGVYELKNILIEGHAFEINSDDMPAMGMAVDLRRNGKLYSDTNIMANFGYFQLKANPGLWEFSIKQDTPSSELYSLLSVSKEYSTKVKASVIPSTSLAVLDLTGLNVFPVVQRSSDKKDETLFSLAEAKSSWSKGVGFLKNAFVSKKKQADVNIFTVASGHLYERFLGIMTASVMKHTDHTVKFWLIENYMSPLLKKSLPILAEEYGFEYELITYKWPIWLRSQREKQRTIWGYKILFLDVLFPQGLDKVIFVDSDQIVRSDLKELVDLDLEGAPYGYTPMCDSRTEMEGFRFWKQGYWKTHLGEDYKYHISALYVVDLRKFRAIAAGDRLRHHYQTLSADPNSLSNLDQDLPNNLQHIIKIHSLPQDWLWCETWCSDESLKTAKTIDLCNNPLTKEPKLDRARRQIPEWTEYDDSITELLNRRLFNKTEEELAHDEL